MPAVSYSNKMRLSIAAMVVAILGCLGVNASAIEAQDPPSIVGGTPLYGLAGGTGWINSAPLTAKQLKGKVVLVDIWDYSSTAFAPFRMFVHGPISTRTAALW
jgi:hypothetical protein